jgi:hypothetical protein
MVQELPMSDTFNLEDLQPYIAEEDFRENPLDPPLVSGDYADAPPSAVATGDPLQCSHCDRSDFKNLRGLRLHQAKAHGIRSTPDRAPNVPKTKTKVTDLKPKLEQMFGMMGLAWYARDQVCGQVVLTQAPAMATALDHLAQQNSAVRRVLESAAVVGPWAEMVTAFGPVLLAVALHHTTIIPAQMAPLAGIDPKQTRAYEIWLQEQPRDAYESAAAN